MTCRRRAPTIIRPTSGSYHILGGSGADADVRAKVGYLPGDLNMPRAMTVSDAFDYFGRVAGAAPDSAEPLYTLSEMTGDLESLTWFSPWRWYVDDAMLVNGLDWPVLLPFGTAIVGLVVGWQVFIRRDLEGG